MSWRELLTTRTWRELHAERHVTRDGKDRLLRPVIGYATRSGGYGDPRVAPYFFNNQAYAQAIADHGGAPLMIPSLSDGDVLASLYELLDGLLLAGGPDVDPSYYHEPRHESVEVDEGLDKAEQYLIRRALEDDLPVLGICRGVQLLNVVGGGTLYQDLPTHQPGGHDHAVSSHGRRYPAHTITVVPGTKLATILAQSELRPLPVNTLHHQGLREVAAGFRINAVADDGLVEGIEDPRHSFVLGVQCHPEELYAGSPVWRDLFRAFVAEATRRAERRAMVTLSHAEAAGEAVKA